MSIEEPSLMTQYSVCFQPLSIASILAGIYGLTITMKSLHEVAPGKNHACLIEKKDLAQSLLPVRAPLTKLFKRDVEVEKSNLNVQFSLDREGSMKLKAEHKRRNPVYRSWQLSKGGPHK